MKIVLDTNCLIVSILPKSKYHWIFEAVEKKQLTIAFTNEVLTEYEELLTSFYSITLAEHAIMELLNLKNAELVTVYYYWDLIRADPDDNKFVDCAIACNADYIVTHDKHFKELDNIKFPKITHVTIPEFEQIFHKRLKQK